MSAFVLLGAAIVAVVGARPYAASWNDGAWLASIECLADHGTLAIDESIYVVPHNASEAAPTPYSAENRLLMERGTLDKLFIGGRYYAAKPPVPTLLLAGAYRVTQVLTGITARDNPAAFARAMTWWFCSVPYVVAVYGMFWLAYRLLGLHRWGGASAASAFAVLFGLGTMALSYTRHVNSHLLQLGAAALLFCALHLLAERTARRQRCGGVVALAGTAAGIGYVADQGVGPLLLACVLPVICVRTWPLKRRGACLFGLFLLTALPWVAAQHALNWHVGGQLGPLNSNPAHFRWPGSPWTLETMTGGRAHHDFGRFASYALQMVVGKKGFLLYNPLLLVAVAGCASLVRRRRGLVEWPELCCAAAWSIAAWLLYAASSNNYAGDCISIRWFLPLLVPGCYLLLVLLRERPEIGPPTFATGLLGVVLGLLAWRRGPWDAGVVPGYWLIDLLVLAVWIRWAVSRRGNPCRRGQEPQRAADAEQSDAARIVHGQVVGQG